QRLNINYIDPCWEIEKVMSHIAQSEVLFAEAMHGAIVADSLRVPWVCIHSGDHVLPFKWNDWCSSVQVPYQPQQIPVLHPEVQGANLNLRTQQWWEQNQVARALQKIVRNPPAPILSKDVVLQSLLSRLDDKLEVFKRDLASGCFAVQA
ncbi:MAG: polysaccharide pyruvyl transferase family protein, partial [Cytophagaceae bacterium]